MGNDVKQSIIDLVKACDSLQLCTFGLGEYPETRHVMNKLNFDISDLDLHFMTNENSPKYGQILKNPNVCLYYFNPANRHAVRLFGSVEIIKDIEEKKKYWNDDYKVFGYSDNDFALLRVVPKIYKFYIGSELKTGDL